MQPESDPADKLSCDPSPDAVNAQRRRTTRRQLWLVLLGLFLVAIAYTGWRWYQGEYLVGDQPIGWKKAKWSVVERELDRGRRMMIFLGSTDMPVEGEPAKVEPTNDEFLRQFETEEIRKLVFYSQRVPLKVEIPKDEETREAMLEKLKIESTPCCVLTGGKDPATILVGQVTSQEIADKMKAMEGRTDER